MEKVRQNGFDWFKGCACIAVILIHYYFPNNIGIGIRTISRFAVPVFLWFRDILCYLEKKMYVIVREQ